MDLGVGSFVFSQGVVSSIPLLKDAAYLTAPLLPKLISTVTKTIPVIFIGLLRVLLVKGTEYPVGLPPLLPTRTHLPSRNTNPNMAHTRTSSLRWPSSQFSKSHCMRLSAISRYLSSAF